MNVEFLREPRLFAGRPLIRFHGHRAGEVEYLRTAACGLADGRCAEFSLHEQPRADMIGGCRFVCERGDENIGVRLPFPDSRLSSLTPMKLGGRWKKSCDRSLAAGGAGNCPSVATEFISLACADVSAVRELCRCMTHSIERTGQQAAWSGAMLEIPEEHSDRCDRVILMV
jgi:hypothetical protein